VQVPVGVAAGNVMGSVIEHATTAPGNPGMGTATSNTVNPAMGFKGEPSTFVVGHVHATVTV